jgi:hypothetical protein
VLANFQIFGELILGFGQHHFAPKISVLRAQLEQGIHGFIPVSPAGYLPSPSSLDPTTRLAPVVAQLVAYDKRTAHGLAPLRVALAPPNTHLGNL